LASNTIGSTSFLRSSVKSSASPHRISGTISLAAAIAVTLAVHGPLLMMQLPLRSSQTGVNMFLAQHYARHWFNTWNPGWGAGFSQTATPPLAHQWVGLFSTFMGLTLAYMLVQLCAVLLLTIGTYRFAAIWTHEQGARIAAVASAFLGSGALLIYYQGDLPASLATSLLLLAAASLYRWATQTHFISLVAGVLLAVAAAAADLSTAIFAGALFCIPVLLCAAGNREDEASRQASSGGALSRGVIFIAVAAVGSAIALWPAVQAFFAAPASLLLSQDAAHQNIVLDGKALLGQFLVPYGALLLALPVVFSAGWSQRRFRPLFIASYLALIIGLGATTPAALVFGRRLDSELVMRFIFWATLLMLPIVGALVSRWISRGSLRTAVALAAAAVLTFSLTLTWMTYHPLARPFKTEYPINFLNRDNHTQYRYLTLGFGPAVSTVSINTGAGSIDSAFSGGRLLPELAPYGNLRLDSARQYGATGMEALRAVLKHANNYGLKFIFVRDRFYEPLVALAGWRQVEAYDNGNVTLWSKEDVPTARPLEDPAPPNPLSKMLWGTVPLAACLLGLLLVFIAKPQEAPMKEAL
jgi:hypothetical protein